MQDRVFVMDLSKIEGLTEEQQKAILAAHEAETSGLKSNNAALLEEKRKAKELADEASRKAKEEADKLAIATAKSAGDLKALEDTLAKQFSERETALKAENEKLKGLLVGGARDSIVGELANSFVSAEAGKMLLKQMVEVSPSDNGMVTTFKDSAGQVITTDKKVFADWLKGQDAFKPLIKGVDSSGGGASGGSGGGGAAPTDRAAKVAAINAKFTNQ